MTLIRYEDVDIRDLREPLVDLAGYPFVPEPSYYRQGLSDTPRMLARQTVAAKLLLAQHALDGPKFKIWDAWRPRSVQNNIYRRYAEQLRAEHPDWSQDRLDREVGTFVTVATDPARIPPHSTGGTLDLTLVDADGNELDMGTGFDHFGPESAADYFDDADVPAGRNRRLLRSAMRGQGFRVDSDEWWHFDFGNQLWAVSLGLPCAFYGEASEVSEVSPNVDQLRSV